MVDLATPAAGAGEPHATAADELLGRLASDAGRGIDEHEADARLTTHGPNRLPQARADPVLLRALRQLHDPLVYVLLAAAATSLALDERVDTSVILGVVTLNALVGFVQESRALAALDSLRSMTRGEARVVRAGRTRTVASEELVPGDVVVLTAGEKVPADLRVLASTEVRVDESALTGESTTVTKEEAVLARATRVADRSNMLHAGTLLRAGTAHGVVTATGGDTELGDIHRLVSSATVLATPLTRTLARFSALLSVVIVGLAALAFTVGIARGEAASAMFTAAVALAVGAIPEGLPAAVTITMAVGVRRMVRRRAVVRRLPAVETLGSTTVICTDKTGTLTTNEMTVREIWTPDGQWSVSGTGYDPAGRLVRDNLEPVLAEQAALSACLDAGAACSDAELRRDGLTWVATGEPTEVAMVVVAAKAGAPATVGEAYERVATIPFDARRQHMATLHRSRTDGHHLVLVKGAAETVARLCTCWLRADGTVEAIDEARVDAAIVALAAQGLRVLATASSQATPSAFAAGQLTDPFTLTGLQAMLDPPRPAASAAIAACHAAGIEVRMITGDHVVTAAAVAAELGLDPRPADERLAVTGAALAAMPAAAYAEAVASTRVFARVSPEEKLRLVEALQERGEVVAMTGDGVNDAPALRRADIGIAMGRSGTEVAKDAADMVLLDDDFATIEAAVEEGRGVFDNLTKFIVWTLPTNLGEGLVILAAILLGTALPILPTQILWINMTTAVVLGLTLALEPREPGIMRRAPRAPGSPLLAGALVWRTVLVSILLVAAAGWVFVSEQSRGASLSEARTAAVNVFVLVEIAYLFSCRSLTRASWRLGLLSNPWVIGGVAVQVVAQAGFTYLPVMNRVFATAPLDLGTWLRLVAVVAVVGVVVALDKHLALARSRGLSAQVR